MGQGKANPSTCDPPNPTPVSPSVESVNYTRTTKRTTMDTGLYKSTTWTQENGHVHITYTVSELVKSCETYAKLYGGEASDYLQMLIAQDLACYLCRWSFKETRFMLDHCHITNQPRKFVCSSCNNAVAQHRKQYDFAMRMNKTFSFKSSVLTSIDVQDYIREHCGCESEYCT